MVRKLLGMMVVVGLVCGNAAAQDEGFQTDKKWRLSLSGSLTSVEIGGGDDFWGGGDDGSDWVHAVSLRAGLGYMVTTNLEVTGTVAGTYIWGGGDDGGLLTVYGGVRWYFSPGATVNPFVSGQAGGTFGDGYCSAAVAGGGGVEFMINDSTSFDVEYLLNYAFSTDDEFNDGHYQHAVVFGLNWRF